MVTSATKSPAFPVPDMQQLKLHRKLTLFRICPPGSTRYIDQEKKLLETLHAVLLTIIQGWMLQGSHYDANALAWDVCADLIERLRSGQLYRFTTLYLLTALRLRIRPTSGKREMLWPWPGDIVDPKSAEDEDPSERLAVQRRADEQDASIIRELLKYMDQRVFDAWVENDSTWGWQSRLAEELERNPGWVTQRMDTIRQKVQEARSVEEDPDEFMARLHLYREYDRGAFNEPWSSAGSKNRLVKNLLVRLDYYALTRSLMKIFRDQPAIQTAIAHFGIGLTDEQLDQVHDALVLITKEAIDAALAERFYQNRMLSGRDNLRKAIEEMPPTWLATDRPLLDRLLECATVGQSFGNLVEETSDSAEIVRVLIALKEAVRVYNRSKR